MYVCLLEIFSNLVQAEIFSEVTDKLEHETNPVTFSCQATGDPVPFVSWYLNDIMINVSDTRKYNVSDLMNGTVITSYFTIANVQSSDVGTYSCEAENFIGIGRSSGMLTVNCKYTVCSYICTAHIQVYTCMCCTCVFCLSN